MTGVFLCWVGQTGFGDLAKVEGRGGKSARVMGQPCTRGPWVGCYVSWGSMSFSMLCGNVDGREVWGSMDTCICMAESLHYSPETITVLIGYTPIQNVLGVKKIKKDSTPGEQAQEHLSYFFKMLL